ncbi:hypothetical protein [Chitinimonas naiadis]
MRHITLIGSLFGLLILAACERTVVVQQPVPAESKTSPGTDSDNSKVVPDKPGESKEAAPPPPAPPPPEYEPEMPTKPPIGN